MALSKEIEYRKPELISTDEEEEGCNQYASVQVNFSDKDWGSWIVCKTDFDKYLEIEKGKRK